jgi:hypothetical protein
MLTSAKENQTETSRGHKRKRRLLRYDVRTVDADRLPEALQRWLFQRFSPITSGAKNET